MTWRCGVIVCFALIILVTLGAAQPSHAQDDDPPDVPYYRDLTWSPDGTQLAFSIISDTDYTIAVYDFNTATITPLTADLPGTQDTPIWSPDSQRLAIAVHPEIDTSDDYTEWVSDIWLMNRDGSNALPLPNTTPDFDLYPIEFSPDGTTLAAIGIHYNSKDDIYKSSLWLLEVDGPKRQQIQLGDGDEAYGVAYSPDGTQLAVMADGPDYAYERVWLVDAAGVQPPQNVFETDWGLDDLAWSFDGRQLFFTQGDGGEMTIFDVETHQATVLTSFLVSVAYEPVWSPDGARIAFAMLPSSSATYRKLWLVNPDSTHAVSLAGTVSGDHSNFTWSPDGSRIAFVADDWTTDYVFLASNIWVIDTNGAHLTKLTVPAK